MYILYNLVVDTGQLFVVCKCSRSEAFVIVLHCFRIEIDYYWRKCDYGRQLPSSRYQRIKSY